MNFYTSSTFRRDIESLTKKPREGYMSVTKDICKALTDMPDNILRDTNDRVRQLTKAHTLHQVEFAYGMIEMSHNGCLSGV